MKNAIFILGILCIEGLGIAQADLLKPQDIDIKMISFPLQYQVKTSKIIVRATVENVQYSTTTFNDAVVKPIVYYSFRIEKMLKGRSEKITFQLANIDFGPISGSDDFSFNDSSPFLNRGDDVILFLSGNGSTPDSFIDQNVLFVNNENVYTRFSDSLVSINNKDFFTVSLEKIDKILDRELVPGVSLTRYQSGDLVKMEQLPPGTQKTRVESFEDSIIKSSQDSNTDQLIGTRFESFLKIDRVGDKAELPPVSLDNGRPKDKR
ncbi:MAG: hypothetical protein EOO85_16415 [Pedobacter sp.]|nr:MAG: hypothetical protein EOO85_16415 [Pedobacter sp.]